MGLTEMFYNRFLGDFVSINLFVLKIGMSQQTFFTSKCFDVEIIEKYHVVKGCLILCRLRHEDMSPTLKMFFDARFVAYVFSRHKYPIDEFEIVVYRVWFIKFV